MKDAVIKKICIYGGTFNPIHNGHIEMVMRARDLFGFDKVIILPTGGSYLKNNVLSSDIRFEMVNIAVNNISDISRHCIEVSDIEVKRQGPSYTYETLEIFEQLYPDCGLYFLIGEDSLRYMDKWKQPQVIFDKAHILVAKRKSEYDNNDIISIEEVREDLLSRFKGEISVFDFDNDISSTYIRNAAHQGLYELIEDKVPSCILEYIREKRLY